MTKLPKVIQVECEVEEVTPVEKGAVRVHGYVGDYQVTLYFSADEARKKGLQP